MAALPSVPRDRLVFHVLEPRSDGCRIELSYAVCDTSGAVLAEFTELVELPAAQTERRDIAAFTRALRLLALAAGTSYYKTCIPPTIAVEGGLTSLERDFLAKLIRCGLAEFAYRNHVPEALDPTIEAVARDDAPRSGRHDSLNPRRLLVAVGGGKDSIVTIESVRKMPVEVALFSVNEYEPIRATADHAGLPLLVASRQLDPLLFELNAQGALNGHVPVTAINSVIASLTAIQSGFDAVVFSNEASSSAGNLTWHGVDVNHQWSKGLEFESLMRDLVGSASLSYFSFLRPLTELSIMRRFSQLASYHPIFTSCNRAFHLDPAKRRLWCGDCPKCRFVFLCLAPFVAREALLEIFGHRDLLADQTQREGFLELLNVDERLKPFECVGEPVECRVALALLGRHPDWTSHPFLSDPSITTLTLDEAAISDVFAFHGPHFLPKAFEKVLRGLL